MQGGTQCVGEAVCTRETFQTVEQRPQVREIVRHVREHRPFEKEFVNEVRPCSQVFRLPFSCAVAFLCLLPSAIYHSCDAIVCVTKPFIYHTNDLQYLLPQSASVDLCSSDYRSICCSTCIHDFYKSVMHAR